MTTRILIIGGYGVLGSRMAITLAYEAEVEILIGRRGVDPADALIAQMRKHQPQAKVRAVEIDASPETIGKALTRHKPDIVLQAAPLADMEHAVAKACIERGIHYIDLDIHRKRVAAISELDKDARKAKVLCVSGAGLAPGLSSAVVDHFLPRFKKLERVEYGFSFGSRVGLGHASLAQLLSLVGQEIEVWDRGEWRYEYGWHPAFEQVISSLGSRRFGSLDTPDTDLFRQRYEGLQTVRAYGGISPVGPHAALYALSWLVRWKLVENLSPHGLRLQQMGSRLYRRGDDRMGIYFHLEGKETARKELGISWYLVAKGGDGPQVVVTPAILLARKLVAGECKVRGATACVGLVTLEEILAELSEFQVEVFEE